MPLCGFNDKMLKALTLFNEGLVEHGLQYRSAKNNESIEQAIKREISDMTRLLLEIDTIEDSAKRTITEGMIKYALGFYLIIRKNDINEYPIVIDNINKYFHFMDNKYYSELEGKPEDMKELAEQLNHKDI